MSAAPAAIAMTIDSDRDTAGLARRAAAALVDTVVLLALATLVALPQLERLMVAVMTVDAGLFLDTLVGYDRAWWRTAGLYAIELSYGVLMLGRYGRTVGMMALRARVTDSRGADISVRRAALRTAAYLLPQLAATATHGWSELASASISALWTIGLLWIMVDGAHQGYHDKIARTVVMLERRYLERKRAGGIEAGAASLSSL